MRMRMRWVDASKMQTHNKHSVRYLISCKYWINKIHVNLLSISIDSTNGYKHRLNEFSNTHFQTIENSPATQIQTEFSSASRWKMYIHHPQLDWLLSITAHWIFEHPTSFSDVCVLCAVSIMSRSLCAQMCIAFKMQFIHNSVREGESERSYEFYIR